MKNNNGLDIFTGTSNPELASEVSKILGIAIAPADVGYFSDGELKVCLLYTSPSPRD